MKYIEGEIEDNLVTIGIEQIISQQFFFMFLDFPYLIKWQNTWDKITNTTVQCFGHPTNNESSSQHVAQAKKNLITTLLPYYNPAISYEYSYPY